MAENVSNSGSGHSPSAGSAGTPQDPPAIPSSPGLRPRLISRLLRPQSVSTESVSPSAPESASASASGDPAVPPPLPASSPASSPASGPPPLPSQTEGNSLAGPDPMALETQDAEGGEDPGASDYIEYLQALKVRLSQDSARLGRRFLVLIPIFLMGTFLLLFVLGLLHHYLVGRYAVIEAVSVTQNAGNQGQLEIAFRVISPGLVHLRRTSGTQTTDLLYEYVKPCDEKQQWNWNYVPGSSIDLTLWSRSGFRRTYEKFSFPTSKVVDIVILMDTTESMDASINALKEKCLDFAVLLERQAVKPRFSLIGFGDATLGRPWISETEFTEDSLDLLQAVTSIPRFEGGDLPESSLDALRLAIEKVKEDSKGHAIRFYLVTDQKFHPVTADGKESTDSIAKALMENRIMLEVFCHQRFQSDFTPLVGDCGHVREIENFGEVLSQGRFLED